MSACGHDSVGRRERHVTADLRLLSLHVRKEEEVFSCDLEEEYASSLRKLIITHLVEKAKLKYESTRYLRLS